MKKLLVLDNDLESKLKRNVDAYFKKCKLPYEVHDVFRKSNHPDDDYLFIVIAKHKYENNYAVWTCWNESTKSLNHGHYDISSIIDCISIVKEYTYLI